MLQQLRTLARYNAWMNDKLYAACGTLDDAARKRDTGAFFSSIHGTLNHILLGDRAWLWRFTGDRERSISLDERGEPIRITSLRQELYSDFDTLRRERRRTDGEITRWAEDLTATALEETILRYKSQDGTEHNHPLWWAALHLFNHQTHHRGQVTTLLTQQGVDVGDTDLILMLRDA